VTTTAPERSSEPAGDQGTQGESATLLAAVPIAEGGSRLLLSDTLSNPPQRPPGSGTTDHAEAETPAGDEPVAAATPVAFATGMAGTANSAEPEGVATVPATEASAAVTAEQPSAYAVGEGVGPLTAARLAATRQWLAAADDRHFSIQLLLTDFARRANLERFLHERQDAGEMDDYYVFETRIRSNVWYGVLYREYASFGDAKAALEALPEEFRFHQPFIRNVRDIATLG
jgi:septal ring-binding cell division protein DamX